MDANKSGKKKENDIEELKKISELGSNQDPRKWKPVRYRLLAPLKPLLSSPRKCPRPWPLLSRLRHGTTSSRLCKKANEHHERLLGEEEGDPPTLESSDVGTDMPLLPPHSPLRPVYIVSLLSSEVVALMGCKHLLLRARPFPLPPVLSSSSSSSSWCPVRFRGAYGLHFSCVHSRTGFRMNPSCLRTNGVPYRSHSSIPRPGTVKFRWTLSFLGR